VSAEAFVVLFSTDLMFESRVEGAARFVDLELRQVGRLEDCVTLVNQPACVLLLLDLEATSVVPQEVISALGTPRPPVIAYGPHVQSDLLESAVAAGCDQVLPRSRFVNELNSILQSARPTP
jgi:DNA-binding NarL/FixJ family response regulator